MQGEISGLKKNQALEAVAKRYSCPSVEYDEDVVGPPLLLRRLGFEKLREEMWFPRTVEDDEATVIASAPSPELAAGIKKTLRVKNVHFQCALPSDLIRIIEHNQDLNPGFPATAGRTPLAQTRTYLAGRRSFFAHFRTLLAKSRTGLAFIRTGLSFVTIALLFIRLLGAGYYLVIEAPLLVCGIIMVYDGIKWYLPAREIYAALPACVVDTEPTGGTTVLAVSGENDIPRFHRSEVVAGAAELRADWDNLSPVMRRRYLASDRTDLAEERTVLACFRTRMANARTGLAFTRTGFAFISLGLGLLRHFHASRWLALDLGLIVLGIPMATEGFLWYFKGRRAGVEGLASVRKKTTMATIWDFFFPHRHAWPEPDNRATRLPVRSSHTPGIWGTTGHALERTMLAERRNVMARLRTFMARARTGFAFIRTGLALFLIGVAFRLSFAGGAIGWSIFDYTMMMLGIFLVVDGFVWSIPAERMRRQFPYCYGDMEIILPDYGTPARRWQKAVFSNGGS